MSKATKKKHVEQEVLYQFELPQENQQIVKVIASRGNNLHEVVTPDGDQYLVSMPSKFRKSIWIKRGDYVIVEPIEEGNKVKAEIVTILLKEQIKYIKEEGKWPSAFDDKNSSSDDSDSDKLFRNTNRCPDVLYESTSGSETDDEDCDEDDDEEYQQMSDNREQSDSDVKLIKTLD